MGTFILGPGNDVFPRPGDNISGDDIIIAGSGDDTVDGGAGDDSLTLEAGDDRGFGGAGDDGLSGADGDDTLSGLSGNDGLAGDFGADSLAGGGGDDSLNGGDGSDTLFGGDGNDVAIQDPGVARPQDVDRIDLGAGNDRLEIGGNSLHVTRGFGGLGEDTLVAIGDITRVTATDFEVLENAFVIRATAAQLNQFGRISDTYAFDDATQITITTRGVLDFSDTLDPGLTLRVITPGVGGNVTLGLGDDETFGGDGADAFFGLSGDDTLRGGFGNDTLDGGRGADELAGGSGNDTYYFDNVGDRISDEFGSNGPDNGVDHLFTTLAATTLHFAVDNMTLLGGAKIGLGNGFGNVIRGTAGANRLEGRNGADTLIGGTGADILVGGDGADRMAGGDGFDTFRFDALSEGGDVITDFRSRGDRLFFENGGFEGMGRTVVLVNGAAPEATRAVGTFLFDTGDRVLSWDADGTGAGEAVAIATLERVALLRASDIAIV